MGNLWLKIRIWAKVTAFSLIALYVLMFIWSNSGQPVEVWVWFNTKPHMSVLLLLFVTFFVGVAGTLLVRTILTTIRQIREAASRGRAEKLEREVADMRAKASKLQTRDEKPETGT